MSSGEAESRSTLSRATAVSDVRSSGMFVSQVASCRREVLMETCFGMDMTACLPLRGL